ncbi:flagellar M-ring protein FliF [Roseomonas frigidaquae]|uniref:Flagellar M-ring protein n=1 Tax=Falsiroseomonas frigidaquae TaxID=487318 RepID=A0ABX1ESM9_9PROT|nr:flagellar basal-body MS-ring/collar protein FliF [Falsiroseomonas frigidaquae]NKE43313.1 flagellar M-ring protein FliF [Falsiroseomonas frigidaquae]
MGGLGNLLAVLRGLGPMRLAALGGIAVVTLGLIGFLAIRTAEPPMGLLYGDLDQRDASQVVAALERARVPHRIGVNGTEVLVPLDQVPRLRLQLARDGIPAGGSLGYEIFDRQGGLTATPFQQDLNRLRALEGEIARSIRTLTGVAGARVHLVLPRREPFSRERGEAQASVVLQMRGGARLDREGVQAVLHLVSAAVPGLRPQNVSIVDGRAELLARGGQALPGSEQGVAMSNEELRRAQEIRIARNVEEMLERSIGAGRVRVEATVELDTDRVQTTEERFDPDNQVPRSTTSNTQSNRSGEAQNTSVANQLPGAPATQNAGPQNVESRQEETTNFEIGRTTRNTLRQFPMLRRLSVAVMVDGVTEPAATATGTPQFRERTPEELERISALVRGAIGYDERRGDRLEVVSLRFAQPEMAAMEEAPGLVAGLLTPALVTRLAESGLVAVVALAALLLLGRPMVSRLTATLEPRPAGAIGDAMAAASLPAPAQAGGPTTARLVGEAAAEEELVDVAMVEGQLKASSLQRVAGLVEKHPDEALALVRRWLAPEDRK